MHRDRWSIAASLVVLVLLATVGYGWADSKPPEIFPLDKIRRGQTGYGLTTMKGVTPERFTFEIIGVQKNFSPKLDIILVKSDDPKLEVSGFWRGMSGSPLFIEGKLACAFSYGFRFNKVAIGGCTPIQVMKKEGFMPTRRVFDVNGNSGTAIKAGKRSHVRAHNVRWRRRTGKRVVTPAVASFDDWLRVAPERTVESALERLGEARSPWLTRTPLPPAPRRGSPTAGDDDGMIAAAVPLSLSGFSAPAYDEAKKLFGAYPIEPMRAGGTGSPNDGPHSFQLGGSIGVQLARGDMSGTAVGTVSYVDGDRVLAFGHPLFQAGEFYAPVTAAEVHTVIPSAMSPFVVASPLRELGSLVQDRQSTIMADTRLETRMIPLDLYIETEHRKRPSQKGEFHVEIVDNRFLTAPFAGIAAISAISHFLPDRDHATVAVDSTVHVRGYKPLQFVDYLYADDGVMSVIGGSRGLRVLVPLLNNPFAPVVVERVEMRARIRYEANFGTLTEVRLPTTELSPGARSHATVVMTTYDGATIVERVPFDVPASLAGSIIRLEVTAGDSADLDVAPPTSIEELMAAFRQLLPGNVFAVTLHTANEGVAIDGKLVRDLPHSALDRLRPGSRTQRADVYRPISRSVYPSRRVINGSKSVLVQIAER